MQGVSTPRSLSTAKYTLYLAVYKDLRAKRPASHVELLLHMLLKNDLCSLSFHMPVSCSRASSASSISSPSSFMLTFHSTSVLLTIITFISPNASSFPTYPSLSSSHPGFSACRLSYRSPSLYHPRKVASACC